MSRNALIFLPVLLCITELPALGEDSPPATSFPPQKPYTECVKDPKSLLALSFQDFDQGVRPDGGGSREEWGWRPIGRQVGCETATAILISEWRQRHGADLSPGLQGFLALHEGMFRAGGGDYAGAIPLIEEGRTMTNDVTWQAYLDAIQAFLRSDHDALIAARERLLAVPEPPNWLETQRMYREQAGQEMEWPQNVEATNRLVRCFGKPYRVYDDC